jgi:hypothetical protein
LRPRSNGPLAKQLDAEEEPGSHYHKNSHPEDSALGVVHRTALVFFDAFR